MSADKIRLRIGENSRNNKESLSDEMRRPSQYVSPQGWRIINFVMAVFFILAACANVNDGDWYLWVPMYTVPSLLCLSAGIKPSIIENHVWKFLTGADFIICALYGLFQMYSLFRALASSVQNPLAHEEGREMGGLLIILTWAGITRFSGIHRGKKGVSNQSLMTALLWIMAMLAVIPLFTWSLCFVGDWHKRLGHCNNMFLD